MDPLEDWIERKEAAFGFKMLALIRSPLFWLLYFSAAILIACVLYLFGVRV